MASVKIDSEIVIEACKNWLTKNITYTDPKYTDPTMKDKFDHADNVHKCLIGLPSMCKKSNSVYLDDNDFSLLEDFLKHKQ